VLKWVNTNFALALSVATTGIAIIRTKTPEKDGYHVHPKQFNEPSLINKVNTTMCLIGSVSE
jgi:hypothetical protein